jgi:hypothetical protein
MGSSADAAGWAFPKSEPQPADRWGSRGIRGDPSEKGTNMILATTKVEDVDRFLDVFSAKGAEKRGIHGSKGATVFQDPSDDKRMWVLFDWDAQGWAEFVSDPEVPPILKAAGHVTKPESAALLGQYQA